MTKSKQKNQISVKARRVIPKKSSKSKIIKKSKVQNDKQKDSQQSKNKKNSRNNKSMKNKAKDMQNNNDMEYIDTRKKKNNKAEQKLQNRKMVAVNKKIGDRENKYSDQKNNKLNSCCLFCNNRLLIDAVKNNDIQLTKKLLNDYDNITNPFQPYSFYNEDQTALKYAAESGNKEMIKLFINELNSHKQRKELGETMLQKFDSGDQGLYNFKVHIKQINQARGSKQGNDAFLSDNEMREKQDKEEIFQENRFPVEFLKQYIEQSDKSSKRNNSETEKFEEFKSQIIHYVRSGMVKEALYLIQYDFSSLISDFNRLYVAALTGDLPEKIVRISINKQSHLHSSLSPLHCACINPNPNVLKTFLKLLPVFSLPDKNRRNLVHYAAANRNADIIKFLLSNGCDPNEQDSQRKTPLMIACELGRIQVVQALLEHFQVKRRNNEQKRREKLIKQKKKVPKGKKKKQQEESEDDYGNEDSEEEEDDIIDINYLDLKDRSSMTALQYAASKGHLNIVKVLVDEGADVNIKNSSSLTPILNAASYGYLEIVKYLHENGADLSGKSHRQKDSALILAVLNGHYHIVEYILNNNLLDVNSTDSSGNTPLHYAAGYGWPKIAEFLLRKGADPNKKNLWNTSAASIALQKGHFGILDLLVKYQQGGGKMSDQFQDGDGRDLVSQHLMSYDSRIYKHLMTLKDLFKKIKLQPNQTDQYGFNAFHYLCAFSPNILAKKINDNEFEEEEEQKKQPKKRGSKLNQDGNESDEEENLSEEEDNQEDDSQNYNEEEDNDQDSYEKYDEDMPADKYFWDKDYEFEDDENDEEDQANNENEEDENENEDEEDVDENANNNDYDDEDEDMEDYGDEEENQVSKKGYESKGAKKQKEKYNKICEQIIKIANLLEQWGYKYDHTIVGIDGHTPLTLAAQCQNIPMIEWLMERKVQIKEIKNVKNGRNFLHWVMGLIVDNNFVDAFKVKQLLAQIYQKFSKDLKHLASQQDIRGFTQQFYNYNFEFRPLFYVLSKIQTKTYTKQFVKNQKNKDIQWKLIEIIQFMEKINHSFTEIVPQNRSYDSTHLPESESDDISSETENPSSRMQRFNQIYFKTSDYEDLENPLIHKKLGIIDFNFNVNRKGEVFVGYNWLHFITQIIVMSQNCIEYDKLISTIFEKINKNKQFKQQLLQQNIYLETPITLALKSEHLLRKYMLNLESQQLSQQIQGLYQDGSVSYLHFASLVKDKQDLAKIFKSIEKEGLYQQDSSQNTLLHYATYYRNDVLINMILSNINEQKFQKYMSNVKGNCPLHLAVYLQRAALEMPKIEELLINKFDSMVIHLNNEGVNPLMIALKIGSQNETDPITLVKLLLDSRKDIINQIDLNGNTLLHIAAKLPHIPLAFSTIYQRSQNKNHKNAFGNTPLSEAIINGQNMNALFMLQSDMNNIQNEVTLYEPYLKKFVDNNGVITEEMQTQLEQINDINDFILKKEQLQKIALKNNFYGLYHFSNQKNSIDTLNGILMASNFVLFNQLIENYDQKLLKGPSITDGKTLLHSLAISLTQRMKESQLEKEKKDEDEDMDYGDEEKEEDNDSYDEEEEQKPDASSEDKQHFKLIFEKLTQQYGLKLDTLDKQGLTPLHYAVQKRNVLFIEKTFQFMKKNMNTNEIIRILNIKGDQSNSTAISMLFQQKYEFNQEWQLTLLQKLEGILGKNINKLDLTYQLFDNDIDEQQKLKKNPFQTTLRQYLYRFWIFDKQPYLVINSIFDLIECQRNKVIQLLVNLGINFNTITETNANTRPHIWAALLKNKEILRILIQDAKIKPYETVKNCPLTFDQALRNSIQKCRQNNMGYCVSFIKDLVKSKLIEQSVLTKFEQELNNKYKQKLITKQNGVKVLEKNEAIIEHHFREVIKKVDKNKQVQKQEVSLIDDISEMQLTHQLHVLENRNPLELSVLMMKVDLYQQGTMGLFRFYILQLLREKQSGRFVLWTRWGRIGERGQNQKTPFGNDEVAAVKEFKKILKSKSGYSWDEIIENQQQQLKCLDKKYRIVQVGNKDYEKRVMTKYNNLKQFFNYQDISRKLFSHLQECKDQDMYESQKLIMDSVLYILQKKLSEKSQEKFDKSQRLLNMSLTEDNIQEAYKVLKEMEQLLKDFGDAKLSSDEKKEIMEKVMRLNNKYYSLIPTQDYSYSNAQDISNMDFLQSELETLNEIHNFSRTFKISMASLNMNNPLQFVQEILPIKLEKLPYNMNHNNNSNYRMIMKYINNCMLADKEVTNDFLVQNIFSVNDNALYTEDDNNTFNNIHNHFMLWHGTENKNLMGILLKGLRIQPPTAKVNGSLFGKGIYFADMISKSLNYTSNGSRDTFYILLCEVALGNVSNFSSEWDYNVFRPPFDHHSVRIMGKKGPDFSQSVILENNQIYPIGEIIKYDKPQFEKGNQIVKNIDNYAKYLDSLQKLQQQTSKYNKKNTKPKKKKRVKKLQDSDEDMDSEEEDDEDEETKQEEDINEEEKPDQNLMKQLEQRFLNIKERKFDIQPNLINTEAHKQRLIRADSNLKQMYGDYSEYIVYTEKQVRIRYLIQMKKKQ